MDSETSLEHESVSNAGSLLEPSDGRREREARNLAPRLPVALITSARPLAPNASSTTGSGSRASSGEFFAVPMRRCTSPLQVALSDRLFDVEMLALPLGTLSAPPSGNSA